MNTGTPTNASFVVADIGATNARFSLGSRRGLEGEILLLKTADYDSSDALLERALRRLAPAALEGICLAVAGPVDAGRGHLTNGALSFDAADATRRLGCPVSVFNDFYALARALPVLERLEQIGGVAPASGVKAVLGPGTGLGMGLLVPLDGGWRVLSSEGGHADLAPGSPLEAELLALLQAEHGHVSWETVLCGPGLVRLYRAVSALWGAAPEPLSARQISERAVAEEDPVCHQTLESFFAMLGSAAGNLALTTFARGGIYIGGGIVPQLAEFAHTSPLRRRFEERGPMSGLVREIPLFLILDEMPGLLGALACATADPPSPPAMTDRQP